MVLSPPFLASSLSSPFRSCIHIWLCPLWLSCQPICRSLSLYAFFFVCLSVYICMPGCLFGCLSCLWSVSSSPFLLVWICIPLQTCLFWSSTSLSLSVSIVSGLFLVSLVFCLSVAVCMSVHALLLPVCPFLSACFVQLPLLVCLSLLMRLDRETPIQQQAENISDYYSV